MTKSWSPFLPRYLFGAVAAHKFVIAFCIGIELVTSKTRTFLVVIYIFTYSVVSPIGIGIAMVLTRGASAASAGPVAVTLQVRCHRNSFISYKFSFANIKQFLIYSGGIFFSFFSFLLILFFFFCAGIGYRDSTLRSLFRNPEETASRYNIVLLSAMWFPGHVEYPAYMWVDTIPILFSAAQFTSASNNYY